MKPLIIAIDGPSGAGKGTVARAIAGALGYRHLDSGAMYRAVGWKALHDQVPLDDEDAVARPGDRADIDVSDARVTIDGHDVTRAIRTPEIDKAGPPRWLVCQRARRARRASAALGRPVGIVMEGRDIGTVVFPWPM
jgi:cytidylate kinase